MTFQLNLAQDGQLMERRFISEKQLADIAEQRKLDGGGQVDEEPYDPRSLFERLQEQKDKKQAEYEEMHALKNQVSRITEDEARFLSDLAERQAEEERRRRDEDRALIEAYNRAVQSRKPPIESGNTLEGAGALTVSISVSSSSGAGSSSGSTSRKTSAQRSLLGRAVAVKRKLPSASGDEDASSQPPASAKPADPAQPKEETRTDKKSAKPPVQLLTAYETDSESDEEAASPADPKQSTS